MIVDHLHSLLTEQNIPIDSLQEEAQKSPLLQGNKSQITVSEVYQCSDSEISASYRENLIRLENNTYSNPVTQTSKNANKPISRIFYLQDKFDGGAPPYNEVANALKNQLLDKSVTEEKVQYMERLHKHFIVKEGESDGLYTADFQPFILK